MSKDPLTNMTPFQPGNWAEDGFDDDGLNSARYVLVSREELRELAVIIHSALRLLNPDHDRDNSLTQGAAELGKLKLLIKMLYGRDEVEVHESTNDSNLYHVTLGGSDHE